jgi:hypothetical protein
MSMVFSGFIDTNSRIATLINSLQLKWVQGSWINLIIYFIYP